MDSPFGPPTGNGLQRRDSVVIMDSQISQDMVVVEGYAVAGVKGSGSAPDQNRTRELRLKDCRMRQQLLPVI